MKKYILIFCLYFFTSCNIFTVGSYGNAEFYDLNISEQALIDKINEFKKENSQYATRAISDHYDEAKTFYTVYFYLKNEQATIHCVIPTNTGKIGLTSISYYKNFAGWDRVNSKDLTKEKNKEIKKIFETEILNKLGIWK